MAGYPKIWTFIRHERWFKKLKSNERGAVLEMLLIVKEQQDNGHLVVNSVSVLAYELSINRKTLGKLVVKLTQGSAPVLVIIARQPLDLYFPKYLKWQRMSVKEAIHHVQEAGSKITNYQPDQPEYKQPKKSTSSPAIAERVVTDFQLACEYFCRKYQDKVGAVYSFHGRKVESKLEDGTIQVIYTGGEDSGKMSTLFKREWSLTQIKYLIDTMFNSTDEFYRTGGGYSIGVLLANDNKLVQEAKRIHEGTDKLNAAGAKTADSMARVLKKLEKEECLKLK